MAEFLSAASAVLASSQRQVEVSAQNIANMTTPGYRRRVNFEQALLSGPALQSVATPLNTRTDFQEGKMVATGDPSNLAITGDGFFVVQGENRALYTRNGLFKRDGDGRLVTASGLPVQLEGGGDVVLKGSNFKVAPDGAVTDDDEAVGKLAVVRFSDPKLAVSASKEEFTTPPENIAQATKAVVQQGTLEASNVSVGDEMVAIMRSLRSAETGQKLVGVYDDLIGRAITTLGQQ